MWTSFFTTECAPVIAALCSHTQLLLCQDWHCEFLHGHYSLTIPQTSCWLFPSAKVAMVFVLASVIKLTSDLISVLWTCGYAEVSRNPLAHCIRHQIKLWSQELKNTCCIGLSENTSKRLINSNHWSIFSLSGFWTCARNTTDQTDGWPSFSSRISFAERQSRQLGNQITRNNRVAVRHANAWHMVVKHRSKCGNGSGEETEVDPGL